MSNEWVCSSESIVCLMGATMRAWVARPRHNIQLELYTKYKPL